MIPIISITGFYRHAPEEVEDNSVPLLVNSAGHYRLVELNYLETTRLNGRLDYQILYMTKGTAHFMLHGKYQPVTAGNIVIYYPNEPQFYYYRLEENPEVYWIHFTGYQSEELLKRHHLWGNSVQYIGVNPAIVSLFNSAIHEIQLQQREFLAMNVLTLQQICLLMERTREEQKNHYYNNQQDIASAVLFMNENYKQTIVIRELAEKYHMTYNWFIRCFKDFTGSSPQSYLTDVRIEKAKDLLNMRSFHISEIAEQTGYSDPLYFSRIFKKRTGYSPNEYKKNACSH